DTNRAQYVLIKTLSLVHSNICVVGDPDQSIYGWRGADIRNILQFENDFKNAYIITLEHNYRSTANILDASNRLIRNNTTRKDKNLYTSNERGESVDLIECEDEKDEALKIAAKIEKLLSRYKPSEIAVFYRTNAQSRSFEEIFLRKKIPHRVIGSFRFYERKEIKDIIAYLKFIINPYDIVSLFRIINIPPRGIGEKSLEKIIEYSKIKGISFYEALFLCDTISDGVKKSIKSFLNMINGIRSYINSFPPSKIVEDVMMKSGY
ncbi:MAG: UvrD-helicase domain-containing protein, partial [Patescibacteria group bacterium]|nr:UvrD-helicase domain-containing protein [Patescibacteria group bacterium]